MRTIAQALRDEIDYPFPPGKLENRLLRRGLDGTEAITGEILESNAFRGAVADCLYSLIVAPNVSEGDKSVTLPDRDAILRLANSIYRSIGEPEKDDGQPRIFVGWPK